MNINKCIECGRGEMNCQQNCGRCRRGRHRPDEQGGGLNSSHRISQNTSGQVAIIQIANHNGIPCNVDTTDGILFVHYDGMFSLLINTGGGSRVLSDMHIFVHTSQDGLNKIELSENKVVVKSPSQTYAIHHAYADDTMYPVKAYTISNAREIIIKLLQLFTNLLGQRYTPYKALILVFQQLPFHSLYGVTHKYDDHVEIIIYTGLHTCIEEIIYTFIHEFAHVLEERLCEAHGFNFYSIFIAIFTVFIHHFDGEIPEIDMILMKSAKIAGKKAN